ncbi:Hypothetical protein D9617_20g028560 [Elsinoe fawcettii]|nr:Hypothetical protein D9617_20g028560 [Elsinoe fawcettii]
MAMTSHRKPGTSEDTGVQAEERLKPEFALPKKRKTNAQMMEELITDQKEAKKRIKAEFERRRVESEAWRKGYGGGEGDDGKEGDGDGGGDRQRMRRTQGSEEVLRRR